ncbi:MAG: DUF4339 domain-containing protein [Bdellovibrionota bacterium]
MNDTDWTDKKTPLWFIMLPTGHEGPYSLEVLEKRLADRKLPPSVQVWREGLPVAISLTDVLNEIETPSVDIVEDEDIPPPLPPLPIEDEEEDSPIEMPEISLMDSYEEPKRKKLALPVPVIVGSFIALLLIFGLYQWVKDQEVFTIRRYPKMTLEMHKKIETELQFEGFDKKIFFREFASPDLTHIWLVTTGFQRCDVETVFRSVKDRLLTMADEEVEMVSRGKLSGHVTELNVFEFRKGSKIIPGLYEMDVKAIRCEWDGVMARLRNIFSQPEQEYSATTRVVLYPRGAEEFQDILAKLLKKKEDLKLQTKNQKDLFWDDLQMKYQTLHAMTMQIEQHFLDFLDKGAREYKPRLTVMTTQYTRKFGQALTEFVVENEGYFAALEATEIRPMLVEKDYEGVVKMSCKQLGLESMKVIEKLQTMKKPTDKDLKALRPQVLRSFEQLKAKFNQLLIGVTEDRSK